MAEDNNELLMTRKIELRDPEEEILIYRCLKTACHEICHVLGMTHCPYFECLMNGSNLVTEADKKPFALCPICLRKLEKYCEIQAEGIQDRYDHLIAAIEYSNNRKFARELALFKNIVDVFETDTGFVSMNKKEQ